VTDTHVAVVSPSRRVIRRKRTAVHLRRAALRRRRQRETGTAQDILRLAKNSRMYSPLLNNYTLPGNISAARPGGSSGNEWYKAAIVYGQTELIIPNLLHFQEYSIEVKSSCNTM